MLLNLKIICLITFFAFYNQSNGQVLTSDKIEIGITKTIYSEILQEQRILNIYLPPSYDTAIAKNYPIIYLLDGSIHEDFLHIAGLTQFFTMYEVIPETILVGISNIDRKRDYTFPTTIEQDKIDFPTTGGSEKFILFLEKELQPYLTNTYRTDGTETLIGQSLGGLLATEILLVKPTLFDQYIIVSPSLWWNNQSLLNHSNGSFQNLVGLDLKVFVSVAKEHPIMIKDAKQLSKKLKKLHSKELEFDFLFLKDENHATALHQSVYEALKFFNAK